MDADVERALAQHFDRVDHKLVEWARVLTEHIDALTRQVAYLKGQVESLEWRTSSSSHTTST